MEWQERAKGLLKAEMKRKGLTYDKLASEMTERGNPTGGHVLRNKVSRGGFSAAFMLECLEAMGCETLHLK